MKFKQVTAFIRPGIVEQVTEQLQRMGIYGLSITQVKGYGTYTDFYTHDLLAEHVRIEIFTEEVKAEAVVSAIMEAAHIGLPGDGIIAVTPIEQLFRIRTRTEAVTDVV